MTQDMVKDNRESPVKQQTRILNWLANLRAAFFKYRPQWSAKVQNLISLIFGSSITLNE